MRVLVVEDEPLAAFRLARLLARSGATVVGPAATGESAARLLADNPIDFALIDLSLDDGFADDLVERVRRQNIPFALVTGWYAPTNADEGAVAVLRKPYDGRYLIEVIARRGAVSI